MRRPEPVALVAATIIGALAAAATAARSPSPWWAVPVFVGIAGLVLGVQAALSWKPRVGGPPVPAPEALERARELMRAVSRAAGDIRAHALPVPDADAVAVAAGAVVEAAYRLACLVVRSDGRAAGALDGLAVAARRMENVARRVDHPAARTAVLVEDLTKVRRHLEAREGDVRVRLRER